MSAKPHFCPACGQPLTGPDRPVCLACRLRVGLPTAGEVFARFCAQTHENEGAEFDALAGAYPELAEELGRLYAAMRTDRQDKAIAAASPAGWPPVPSQARPRAGGGGSQGTTSSALPRLPGGRYEVQGVVARGGMGVVYAVYDRELNRKVAMKVIGTNLPGSDPISLEALPPAWVDRFVAEAQITAQLDHPNIVPVHEVGIDAQGRLYFTMKLVRGRGLNEIFTLARNRAGGWSLARAIGVIVRVCEAVAHAHECGVVHRDLKPQNILVERFGGVYVMDWGLAKPAGRTDLHNLRPSMTAPIPAEAARSEPHRQAATVATTDSPLVTLDGTVLGTPAYMSPEHAAGRVDEINAASDVYSLGAILYDLLAGHPPYLQPGANLSPKEVFEAVRAGPPEALGNVARDKPLGLLAICTKAMAREGNRRYRDAGELAEDLQAWLDGRVVRAHRTGALAELRAWILRNRLAAFSQASGVTLLVAVLLVVIVLQNRAGRRSIEGKVALEERNSDLRNALYAAAVLNAATALERHDDETARAILDRCEPTLRGWEWRHLDFSLPNTLRLQAHPSSAGGVAGAFLNHDATRILSVGSDRTMREWDSPGGERVRTLPLPDAPCVAALSPDERWMALGGPSGTLELLAATDGAVSWEVHAHGHAVEGLGFSPDASSLASSGRDGSITLWATATGQPLVTNRFDFGLRSLRFSPDGRILLAGALAGPVRLLDARTLEERATLGGAMGPPQVSAAFSPDGRQIVAGGADGVLRLWDVSLARPLWESAAHLAGQWRNAGAVSSNVWTVAFSPDGRWIASAGEDRLIKLWDARSGQLHATLAGHLEGYIPTLRFSHDGRWLLSTGDANLGAVRLWNVHPDRRLTVLSNHTDRVWSAAFTPDSGRLVTTGFDRVLRLADADVGEEIRVFRGHTNAVIWSVAVTPDGRHAVSASQDCTVRVWDLATGAQLRVIQAQTYPGVDNNVTLFVAVSPDGRRIASAGFDGRVQVWDFATGQRLWAAQARTNRLWSVAWSPDGKRIAAGGDAVLSCWEASTGAPLWLEDPIFSITSSVAFSPDSQTLLSGHWSGDVRLSEASTGRVRRTIPAHQGLVRSVTFSPDGYRIASAGLDQLVRLWDTRIGEPALTLPKEPGTINSVTFSPDGKRLVSVNDDGKARVWQTELPAARSP